MRKNRKNEHIDEFMRTRSSGMTLLDDVYFEPSSLPDLAIEDIQTEMVFLNKKIDFPLMINAMTGGTEMTEQINQDLAMLAKEFRIPMQVGSQHIALDEPETVESFSIVRSVIGSEGVVIGNLNANATEEQIKQAIQMLQADAVGLHLNPAQELTMAEGDRNFRGICDNLRNLNQTFPNQLIAKEVGFGISRSTAKKLAETKISMIDVSGAGGTNFVEIENMRNREVDMSEFTSWGIPTAQSLLNVRQNCPDAFVIASGGLRQSTDLLKCFILGADLCAIGGELLRFLLMGGYDYARDYLHSLIEHFKWGMLLLGCCDVEALHHVPYRLTGKLKELQ